MKIRFLSLLVFGALILSACASGTAVETATAPAMDTSEATDVQSADSEVVDTADENVVSFSNDIWPVIEQFALPAHGSEMKGGVQLESYDQIMRYVVPGDPEASLLYKYLTGDGVPVMPPTGKLPDETIQLFYDWIAQGAQNN
ncbi:MAG TPA: hypothetical protein PLL88_01195 [Anaerolineaceae bacterium]|jgi:hypothetical protein|nr:hypothetical protein [Anaerolineaceae bacterium]